MDEQLSKVVDIIKEQFGNQKSGSQLRWPNSGNLSDAFFALCDKAKDDLDEMKDKLIAAADKAAGKGVITDKKVTQKIKDWKDGGAYGGRKNWMATRQASSSTAEATSPRATRKSQIDQTKDRKAKKRDRSRERSKEKKKKKSKSSHSKSHSSSHSKSKSKSKSSHSSHTKSSSKSKRSKSKEKSHSDKDHKKKKKKRKEKEHKETVPSSDEDIRPPPKKKKNVDKETTRETHDQDKPSKSTSKRKSPKVRTIQGQQRPAKEPKQRQQRLPRPQRPPARTRQPNKPPEGPPVLSDVSDSPGEEDPDDYATPIRRAQQKLRDLCEELQEPPISAGGGVPFLPIIRIGKRDATKDKEPTKDEEAGALQFPLSTKELETLASSMTESEAALRQKSHVDPTSNFHHSIQLAPTQFWIDDNQFNDFVHVSLTEQIRSCLAPQWERGSITVTLDHLEVHKKGDSIFRHKLEPKSPAMLPV